MRQRRFQAISWLTVLGGLLSTGGSADAAEELRYGWRDGETYAYKYTISTKGSDAALSWTGSCAFTVSPAPPDSKAQNEVAIGSGTGFVVTPDGMLVTCAHVVKDARKIEARLNGKVYDAVVKAVDTDHDVALVKIAARNLPVLTLFDSDKVELNEDLLVIGYPMMDVVGTSVKTSRGVVSGIIGQKNEQLIQTDAAVNHGNSGGPVVNDRGYVIGIAAAKIERLDVMNVSFIEPSKYVAALLKSNKVDFQQRTKGEVLKGSTLARAVTPSVALLVATLGPNVGQVERKTFTYKGTAKSKTVKNNGTVVDGELMTDTGRMVVNRQGQIVESKSEHELPFLMGRICELFVEPFPPGGESKWRYTRPTQVGEVVGGTNSSGYAGLRNQAASSSTVVMHPAVEIASYQLVNSAEGMATFKKAFIFGTMPKPGQPPFLNIAGEATFEFDQRAGVMQSMDFEFNYDVNGRRLPVKVNYQRVDPKTMKPISGGLASGAALPRKRSGAAAERLPAPSEAKRSEAVALINDLFKKDIESSKSTAKKAELARKMLASAHEEKDDAVARFALLDMAKNMAVKGRDLGIALEAVQELAGKYELPETKLQLEVISALQDPEAPADRQKLVAEAAFAAFEQAAEANEFDNAKQLGSIAITAARKSHDSALARRILERGRQFKAVSEAYAAALPSLEKLKTKPDDPDANLQAGRFYCFVKDRWQDGLSMLAKGSDSALKALAEKELAAPGDAEAQLAVADGWYDLAGSQPPEYKQRVLAHASGWYERAIPGLSGLKKLKAEKRVVSPAPEPSKSSDAGNPGAPAAKSSADSDAKAAPSGITALRPLLERIKQQVTSQRLTKTAEVGFAAGPSQFSGVPETGGVLIGFELSHDGDTFSAIQPIFYTEKGQTNGPIYGEPNGETLKVVAKKGYAVAAVTLAHGVGLGGFGIKGLAITFMEMKPDGLNPEKSYDTEWIGAAPSSRPPERMGGNGAPVVGVFGHIGRDRPSALGLVMGGNP